LKRRLFIRPAIRAINKRYQFDSLLLQTLTNGILVLLAEIFRKAKHLKQ